MPSLEERVAYLEGRSGEHAAALGEVRADIRDLRAEVIRRFEHVDQRLTWLTGLQFATLLAVISAVLGAYFR